MAHLIVQEISANVSHNTVDRLKAIIAGLNNIGPTSIPKSGRKQDHIDRIRSYLTTLRNTNNITAWTASKGIITSVPYKKDCYSLLNIRY